MPSLIPLPYIKPARTPTDLLLHLETKGLLVPDRALAVRSIEKIGYYRLLIYMRAVQDQNKHFLPGISFDDVLQLYRFDRELRLLCLDAVERIEVALRASLANDLAVALGPHFYLSPQHFENGETFRDFFQKAAQARYLAIAHYESTYNTPPQAPIWAVCEAVTYGTLSRLYSGLNVANRKKMARSFGFSEGILVSWFRTLNDLRNRCAHHNRLWNASLITNKPASARAVSAEFTPLTQERFYSRAVILICLLQEIDPASGWAERLKQLIVTSHAVDTAQMGFPADWRTRLIWS